MERQFLIFKETSYSKRGKGADNMIEDDDEGDEKMESDIDKQAKLNEKEVQSTTQLVCQPPETKTVYLYHEDSDLSLVTKLREICLDSKNECPTCK